MKPIEDAKTKAEQKAALKKRHADESRRRHMGLMIVYEKP